MSGLAPDQIERATVLRQRRWEANRIARSLHVPTAAVRQHFGLTAPRRTILSREQENEIRGLFADGIKRYTIARRFGIDHKAVLRICRVDQPIKHQHDDARYRSLADPNAVEVPAWVPSHLTGLYLNVAERHGEEEAASTCRKLKNGRSVAQSRLPAVVSPAGCM